MVEEMRLMSWTSRGLHGWSGRLTNPFPWFTLPIATMSLLAGGTGAWRAGMQKGTACGQRKRPIESVPWLSVTTSSSLQVDSIWLLSTEHRVSNDGRWRSKGAQMTCVGGKGTSSLYLQCTILNTTISLNLLFGATHLKVNAFGWSEWMSGPGWSSNRTIRCLQD